MAEAKTPAKKVGNKTTEIIVGSAAMSLSSAVKNVMAAVEQVKTLENTSQTMTLKVSDLEDKIGGLEQDLKNKTEQNKIEIKNQFEADKKSFVDTYLTEKKMSCIDTAELTTLRTSLSKAEDNKNAEIQKAVAFAVGAAKKDSDNAAKVATLEHEKKEAANAAEISQLKAQNKFLEDQVSHWKTMLEKQMTQETERAKHGAINTLNVGSPNQGR